MKRTTLPAALLVLAGLLSGLLAGCGNDSSSAAADSPAASSPTSSSGDGPPTDASVSDFCQTFVDLVRQASGQNQQDITDAQAVKLAKDAGAKLAQVGTPADMPAGARRAFEAALAKIASLPDDATKAQMSKLAGDLSQAEKDDQQALSDYISATCMNAFEPSASPSAS